MKEKPFKRFWKRWWIFKTHTNANAEFPHEAAHNRICVSILSIRFMISRKILCCWLFKRVKRQTTPWTMSWKLTLKQPRWSNSTTGRRKNMYFWLILVNCPFKEWNVRKIQCRSSMEKRRPTAQRWNTEVQQMLKMILYICTKVSALRNISGKSWVTIHPAHTETIRNTHSEKVQSQMWRGMRKCFTDVQVIVKCCSGDLTSRLNVCVCCRWERQKDKILERGRPIRIQGSAADCPQRAKTVPEPFFFFFCTGASVAHLHSQKILASKKKKKSGLLFYDWTVLEEADRGVRSTAAMAQSVPSVCSPSTGKYWICTLCFLLYGELSFLTFRFPGSTGKKIQILKKENQSQEMHYFIILKALVFPLPPSLKECPRLLSPIICCRLAAAMKPSWRRLRFFTSLADEETSWRVMREGKGGN